MISKVGNYLCHALSMRGCEYSHVVDGLGYGAFIVPIVLVAVLLMHRARS